MRFLELEDVAHGYRRPCIMDVKLGRQTWYPGADPSYIERCRARDAATMQAALGFRICGLQVHHSFFVMSCSSSMTLPNLTTDYLPCSAVNLAKALV